MAPLSTALDATLNPIGASKHSSGKINLSPGKQLTNLTRAYSSASETNFRNLSGNEVLFAANAFEEFDIAFAVVTKSKAFAKIDFFSVQTILHHVSQELSGWNLREFFIEPNDDCLLNTEHSKAFNFLIKSLK